MALTVAAAAAAPLDQTFGSGGVATIGVSGQVVRAFGGTAQPDGKPIVVGGTTTSNGNGSDFFIARLGLDGKLDPTFGGSGEVVTDVAGLHQDDLAQTTVIERDGAILVGGYTKSADGAYSGVLARYRSDGSVDTSFAQNGFFVHAYQDGASSPVSVGVISGIAIDSEGRIVVVAPNLDGSGFSLSRLNADGTLDTSFGTQGTVSVSCGCDQEFASPVLVQTDGKIDVGGSFFGDVRVWRFASGGTEDTLMLGPHDPTGDGGSATASGMVEQPDGQIVVAGGVGLTGGAASDEALALTRFNAQGQLDPTFGTNGVAAVQLGTHDDEAEQLLENPDGTLTAVGVEGVSQTTNTRTTRFAVVHVSLAGALDPSYGNKGTALGPTDGFADGGAILRDGRVYAFGYSGNTAQVMRFTAATPTVVFSPGRVHAGDVVQLTAGNAAGASVRIGGVLVPTKDVAFSFGSPTRLNVTVPPTVVSGKLSVTTSAGTVTSAAVLTVAPTVDPPDWSTPLAPGRSLVITGKNLAGATSVTVDGVAWPFRVNSALQITATIPANAITGFLVVSTAGGENDSSAQVCIQPQIKTASPLTGTAGTIVSITGTGLGDGPGGLGPSTPLGTVVSSSGNVMRVRVGDDVGIQPVEVDSCAGAVTYAQPFKALPAISEIGAGTNPGNLRIIGSNFVGVTLLTFGGADVPFTRVSSTRLDVDAAPAGIDSGKWVVTTAAGSASIAYQVEPAIDSLSPLSGPAGTVVTVHGSAFELTRQVILSDGVHQQLSIPFRLISSTAVGFTIPSAAFTSNVTIQTAGGWSNAIRLMVTPTITSVSPTSGKQLTKLTVAGTGLANVTQVTFDAGSADAVSVTPVNNPTANAVTVAVPASAHSGPIGVSGTDGSATSSKPFTMTLAFYSVSPADVMPGDTVILTGTGLSGTTQVRFSGAAAVPASGVTDTSLSAVVPAGTDRLAEIYTETPRGEIDSGLGVTSVRATSGGQETTTLVVTGDGLDGVTTVGFTSSGGGYVASPSVVHFVYGGAHELRATIPDDAITGPIELGDAQDHSITTQASFAIIRITSVDETSWSPGDTVTITGSGLAHGFVRLNGEGCPTISATDSTLTFTVPADATNGHLVVFVSTGSYDLGEFDMTVPAGP